MEYKFAICHEDVPGLPGLSKGDAVLPWGSEIIEGYEYEVWHRLKDGMPAKTRIEHHDKMVWHTVEGSSIFEISALVSRESEGVLNG